MLYIIKEMSVINKTTNYICECGSHIKNFSVNISQHNKTIKHKNYLENKKPEIKVTEISVIKNNNLPDNKEMEEKKSVKELTSNAIRVRAYRQRKKEALGDAQ